MIRLSTVVLAFALASVVAPPPSDLTGRWVWRLANGDGTFRETVFVLNADGNALTGSVISPTSEQPIVDGAIESSSFRFATVAGSQANPRRTEYRGVASSRAELRITILRPDRREHELTAVRGPDTAGCLPQSVGRPAL